MEEIQLNFTMKEFGKVCVITINEPRIDTLKAPELKTELLRIIAGGWKYVLLNLMNVQAVDSSGLGSITFGKRQLNEVGGALGLCCLQDKVLSLMRIAKLDRVFKIYATESEGLERIQE